MANTQRKPIPVKVGDTFGHFTVIGDAPSDRFGRQRFRVRGECGTEKTMERYQLVHRQDGPCQRCPRAPGELNVSQARVVAVAAAARDSSR